MTSATPVRRRSRPGGRWADGLLATAAGLLVFVVHDVGYLLRTPYWLDEGWVVVSTRVPLSSLRHALGPTPALWALLIRVQEIGGLQRQRIVPLVFAGLAVAMGYALLRVLGHGRLVALVFGAGTVLLAPSMLARGDLKQYTADAFVLLGLLVLVARLDREWSRRGVLALGAAAALAPGVSSAALFTATAAMVAVALAVVGGRHWERLRALAAAVAITVAGYLFWLLVFLLPNVNTALTDYWRPFYPPRSASGVYDYLRAHEATATTGIGVAQGWVAAVLLVVGIAVLLVRRRIATALLVPVAAAGALLAGLLHLSPFLDARTSTWLFVGADVVMAIGLAGLARGLVRRSRLVGGPIALAVLLVPAVAFAHLAWPGLRATGLIPDEDVRAPEQYVAAHRGPADVVVVDRGASYAWAYYAGLDVTPAASAVNATGFDVAFAPSSRVLVIPPAGLDAVQSTLRRAESMTAGHAGATIWIVRNHLPAQEAAAWPTVIARLHPVSVDVGTTPLLALSTPTGP